MLTWSSSLFTSTTSTESKKVAHRDLFAALVVLLVWLPIPIGSNRDWSLAIFEVAVFVIIGIWLTRYAYRPFPLPVSIGGLKAPLVILGIWLLFPLVQLVPVPISLGQLITGDLHAVYSGLPGATDQRFIYFSLDRGETFAGMLRQFALIGMFLLVLLLAHSRQRLSFLLLVIFSVGFLQAFYGLAVYLSGEHLHLWSPGHDARTVSGTYVNQNHFAGLMEMTIAAGMGLLVAENERRTSHSGIKAVLDSASSMLLGHHGIVLIGLLVMLSALVLSTSRGALGSLILALTITILITGFRRRYRTELRVAIAASLLATSAVIWMGTGQLSTKLQSAGFSSNRADLRELSYEMLSESPVVGTGIGTYRWVMPSYKDERFGSGFYEHAHNDFLELLSEQGVLGFALFATALVLIGARVVRQYGDIRDPVLRGASFACLMGCTSLLVHGFVDFNFQIPANAAYFLTLLAIGSLAADVDRRASG